MPSSVSHLICIGFHCLMLFCFSSRWAHSKTWTLDFYTLHLKLFVLFNFFCTYMLKQRLFREKTQAYYKSLQYHTQTWAHTLVKNTQVKAEWSLTLCAAVGSGAEVSFTGWDGLQRNKALTLLAVVWLSVCAGNRVSIIITVIISTSIVTVIILHQMGTSIHRRMER